jgi:hypothetical protein
MRLSTIILLTFTASVASAQEGRIWLPEQSQRANVGQRIALTDVTVTYHRPLANGRPIWGALIPFGEVWRAGANEATTFEVSDPISVEGKPLPRGRYGLFMIPAADKWTVIFSRQPDQWGTYTYDAKEDALRVTVTPRTSDPTEALGYSFDELKADSVTLVLRWEKLAVPIRLAVAPSAVVDRLRANFRGPAQWTWDGWNEAATWCAEHKVALDEALGWADRSIAVEERFENLMTKADLVEQLKKPDAAALRKRAIAVGTAPQIYYYGRQLQADKKQAEAFELFKTVAERFPSHWLAHLGQARIASGQKDFDRVQKELDAASRVATLPEQKKSLEGLLKRARAHQDINP